MNELDRKTVALVGCGTWGRNILRELLALEVQTVVIDPSEPARREALTMGASAVQPRIDGLPAVDGIVVATPATTHAEVIARCLEFECPVFTEKPFTTDLASARRLASSGRGRLFVMHVWRYHSAVRELASWAREERLGRIERIRSIRSNWTSPRTDTDVLWTLLPHDLSIMLEMLGKVPPLHHVEAERCGDAVVGATVHLGSNPQIVVEVSSRSPQKVREIRLHGSEGVASWSLEQEGALQVAHGDRQSAHPKMKRVSLSLDPSPLRRELQAFLSFLRGGEPPASSAEEAFCIVERICEIRQAVGIV